MFLNQLVAGTRIELVALAYETSMLPLHYPALNGGSCEKTVTHVGVSQTLPFGSQYNPIPSRMNHF